MHERWVSDLMQQMCDKTRDATNMMQQIQIGGATNVRTGATNTTTEQQMLDQGCTNCTLGHGGRVTQIQSGEGRECYWGS
jgi:hypothetical protein